MARHHPLNQLPLCLHPNTKEVSHIQTNWNRYAQIIFNNSSVRHRINGAIAAFQELATTINDKSITIIDKPSIHLLRRQMNTWFNGQGGKEFASTNKPLDTPHHIVKKIWVRQWFTILINDIAPVAYLDKK